MIVRRGIEQLGYHQLELKKASNGIEALQVARVWEPDLVISDWHMPEMDGLELLTALNREMLTIQFGFVTTERSANRLQAAVDAGAQFIVQKPFDTKTLHEAVLPIIKNSFQEKKPFNQYHQHINTADENTIRLPNMATLTNTLSTHSTIPVSLEKTESIILEEEHYPYLLGLYSNKEQQAVQAIAITNLEGICILSTLAGSINKEEAHSALAKKTIPKNIIDSCQSVLKTLENTLHNTQHNDHLILRSTNIMRKKNLNLDQLLEKNTKERLDLTLKIDQFHCGRLTLIVAQIFSVRQ